MEVAPFFVDFHHFLSIFTIFCRFLPFFIDFHDLHTIVAIYILSQFTHFFCKFFLAKIASSATSHVFCMYADHQPGCSKFLYLRLWEEPLHHKSLSPLSFDHVQAAKQRFELPNKGSNCQRNRLEHGARASNDNKQ